MFRTLSLVAVPATLLLATLPGARAHAAVSDIRVVGQAHRDICGDKSFNEVTKDATGPIESQLPVNPGCELELCRGLQFADQNATAASTVHLAPCGNITFNVVCAITHGGPANVSLIDTTTGGAGTVIGGFLKHFDDFCPIGVAIPSNQTTIEVTLPDAATIAGRCSKPGDCVTQLFWATPDLTQNYYYCKDTVISEGPSDVIDPTEEGADDEFPVQAVADVADNSATVPSASALKEVIDFLSGLLPPSKRSIIPPIYTLPIEPPVTEKRWVKERY